MRYSQFLERPSYSQLLERLEALAQLDRWGDERTERLTPAMDMAISDAERRLGVTLPDSYKRFLLCTNGYRGFGTPAQDLRPVEEIDWFRVENQQWIDSWCKTIGRQPSVPDEVYLVYGEEQDCINLRVEYLEHALQISDVFEGAVYLLNPEIKAASGEWEAWFMANWNPGADRYPSFYDLVEEEVLGWETCDRNEVD